MKALRATVDVRGLKWNQVFNTELKVDSAADSSQRIIAIPEGLYVGPERLFFIDLKLSDSAGRIVSRNFYWVPGTLTTFDWERTDYTHTPAMRHEDLSALGSLPPAQVEASAEIEGRKICVRLKNSSNALAFQVRAAARTPSGGLIAPVFWSDNWIELTPGESTELTAQLPDDVAETPVIQIDGWNIAPAKITPGAAAAH